MRHGSGIPSPPGAAPSRENQAQSYQSRLLVSITSATRKPAQYQDVDLAVLGQGPDQEPAVLLRLDHHVERQTRGPYVYRGGEGGGVASRLDDSGRMRAPEGFEVRGRDPG